LAQPRVDFGEVRAGVVETLGKKSRTLSEWEAKSVLAWAGIPVLETRRAFSEEEAVDVASQIGFPVVLKLLSETITHKSEVGGVQLNLGNAEAVRRGWRDIREAVSGDDFRGVSVQRMYARRGVELICGWSWDTQFGPVLLFGAGGIFAEVFQDRVLMLPPLSSALALERIRRTRIFSAFAGIRGLPKTNVEEILRVLVRLGDLALAMPEIRELDVNPLVATDEGVLALDARMVVEAHPSGGDC
jgi:acetyltransferase